MDQKVRYKNTETRKLFWVFLYIKRKRLRLLMENIFSEAKNLNKQNG